MGGELTPDPQYRFLDLVKLNASVGHLECNFRSKLTRCNLYSGAQRFHGWAIDQQSPSFKMIRLPFPPAPPAELLSLGCSKVGLEEALKLGPRDQICAIVQVNVPGTFHVVQLFRLSHAFENILTALLGVILITGDESIGRGEIVSMSTS